MSNTKSSMYSLAEVTDVCIAAALWMTPDPGNADGMGYDATYSESDLSSFAQKAFTHACTLFLNEHCDDAVAYIRHVDDRREAQDIARGYGYPHPSSGAHALGHELWLVAKGLSPEFMNRGDMDAQQRLSDAARSSLLPLIAIFAKDGVIDCVRSEALLTSMYARIDESQATLRATRN